MSTTIDSLLQAVPLRPEFVLSELQTHPELAAAQDRNGYSLVHAAASYGQLDLLRALCTSYHVDPNLTDTDGESPLFVAETVEAAKCLVEELGASPGFTNSEGITAEQNAVNNAEDDEGEWTLVAHYLSTKIAADGAHSDTLHGESGVHPPPPLPDNVRVNIGTMSQAQLEDGEAPDPEIRRRIEELAANPNFEGAEGQAALRALVTDVVGDMATESNQRDVRRRT